MSRIILATWGSLGDLHPLIALGLNLRARGHSIVFATTEGYRNKIESLGLQFHAIRPNLPEDPTIIERVMDPKVGAEIILKDFVLGNLRDTYDDLMVVASYADLLVAHEIIYAAHAVAEVLKLRFCTCVMAPVSFFSAYEPIVTSVYPFLAKLHIFGHSINRLVVEFALVCYPSLGRTIISTSQRTRFTTNKQSNYWN